MKKKLEKSRYGYYFILPYFMIFVIFGLYPILYTAYLSFYKWDGISEIANIGFKNYQMLIEDATFWLAMRNTLRIWICNFIPQLGISLFLAGAFSLNRIKGMGALKAIFYLPNLVTAASIGLLFSLFFKGDKSVVNMLLLSTGLRNQPFAFFESSMFTSLLTSYIQWWMWFGYTLIIILTGMTSVDQEMLEAAQVDGASKLQTFSRIILPLIRPTMIYLTLTSIIGGMQLFDVPATLTDGLGSPQKSILTVAMYIYNTGFRNYNMGYAATLSIGLFIIVASISLVYFYISNRKGRD